jgi:hypothetical protein
MIECRTAKREIVSKFEEMCKAFAGARKSWLEYRDRSFANMAALALGFAAYCKLPRENVDYGKPGKTLGDGDFKTKTPIPAVMEFNQRNGFWEIDVYITLFEAPNMYPHHVSRFRLGLRESGEKVLVKCLMRLYWLTTFYARELVCKVPVEVA